MQIARGKIIKIKKGGQDIFKDSTIMTLDSEVTISFSSTFQPVLGDSGSKWMTIVSGVSQATGHGSFTGQFKEMGFKVWTGTSPAQFSFDTTFNMKTSALKDVMEPAAKLINICLPREGTTNSLSKLGAQGINSEIGLIAPGPSLLAVLDSKGKYAAAETYSIRIGAFYLPSILIESVEPTYSSDVDEDGFPIWCTLKVTVSSLYTATQEMVNSFDYSVEQ
jgi:hypothetical protein